jgi:hypothetical protein
MNLSLGQKQFESALSLQSVIHIQVFKHLGRVSGQSGVDSGVTGLVVVPTAPVSVSFTGQTVVLTATVFVTSAVECAGQSVTDFAQEVTVSTVVL